jgi:hypothetical protein
VIRAIPAGVAAAAELAQAEGAEAGPVVVLGAHIFDPNVLRFAGLWWSVLR